MPAQCRVLGSPLLGRAQDTPFLGFGGIPRAKGTAASADGLVIEFERADAVEDIMTQARGPRIGLMERHECAIPRRVHEHEGGDCLCQRRALHCIGCARLSASG